MAKTKNDENITNAVVTEDVPTPTMPQLTVYDTIMANMTPQQFANTSVKLVSVNSTELFWLTSIGQLYNFNNRAAAVEAELEWLMSSV